MKSYSTGQVGFMTVCNMNHLGSVFPSPTKLNLISDLLIFD